MKQTAKALVYLLALALSLAPMLLLVTLPLLLVSKARKLIQHEEKNKKPPHNFCKTVLVTGAPHTKVNNVPCSILDWTTLSTCKRSIHLESTTKI